MSGATVSVSDRLQPWKCPTSYIGMIAQSAFLRQPAQSVACRTPVTMDRNDENAVSVKYCIVR